MKLTQKKVVFRCKDRGGEPAHVTMAQSCQESSLRTKLVCLALIYMWHRTEACAGGAPRARSGIGGDIGEVAALWQVIYRLSQQPWKRTETGFQSDLIFVINHCQAIAKWITNRPRDDLLLAASANEHVFSGWWCRGCQLGLWSGQKPGGWYGGARGNDMYVDYTTGVSDNIYGEMSCCG